MPRLSARCVLLSFVLRAQCSLLVPAALEGRWCHASVARPRAAAHCSSAVASVPATATDLTALLTEAAETRGVDDQAVVNALLELEKRMRAASKEDGALSLATLAALDGSWQLAFTTGTVDMQNKLGARINYFPIKAVQTFDTTTMDITNGIYLGDFAVLRFFGSFEWAESARRLNFDFDEIAIFGLRVRLPKGGAAQIGASTGLGSENNVARAKRDKPAFFNWISADAKIATARGGGGGLALWQRVDPQDS